MRIHECLSNENIIPMLCPSDHKVVTSRLCGFGVVLHVINYEHSAECLERSPRMDKTIHREMISERILHTRLVKSRS